MVSVNQAIREVIFLTRRQPRLDYHGRYASRISTASRSGGTDGAVPGIQSLRTVGGTRWEWKTAVRALRGLPPTQCVGLAGRFDPKLGRAASALFGKATRHIPVGRTRRHGNASARRASDVRQPREHRRSRCLFIRADPNPIWIAGSGAHLRVGQETYTHICAACHGADGRGESGNRVPRIAGQHYPYLRRQIDAAASLHRDLAPPEMTSALRGMSDPIKDALADYVARLGTSEALLDSIGWRGQAESSSEGFTTAWSWPRSTNRSFSYRWLA